MFKRAINQDSYQAAISQTDEGSPSDWSSLLGRVKHRKDILTVLLCAFQLIGLYWVWQELEMLKQRQQDLARIQQQSSKSDERLVAQELESTQIESAVADVDIIYLGMFEGGGRTRAYLSINGKKTWVSLGHIVQDYGYLKSIQADAIIVDDGQGRMFTIHREDS